MTNQTLFEEISNLDTEIIYEEFSNIDLLSTEDIVKLINYQDSLISYSIKKEIPFITVAVDMIVNSFNKGGRLIYVGAGTSGRLGILDAAECPPTFGTPYELVQGIIAGGNDAAFKAIEGAEDIQENGGKALEKININEKDTICGITASGRTPFVIGALKYAKKQNSNTILITTNSREKILKKNYNTFVDIIIAPFVGPEIIAGSTRMKSGTAQKLVLNMLTTTAMIKIGKTYGNIMIDLMPTNDKLKQRAKRILIELTGVSLETAEKILIETNWKLKYALIMIMTNVDIERAKVELEMANGIVKNAVRNILKN